MLKQLLTVVCAFGLLTACASKEQGADLYGNGKGGWNNDVNIMELDATGLTKKFNKETTPVVYFAFNSSSLDASAKAALKERSCSETDVFGAFLNVTPSCQTEVSTVKYEYPMISSSFFFEKKMQMSCQLSLFELAPFFP